MYLICCFESVLAFIWGMIVGSFLNVCIYRLPRNESIVYPGSHCPYCGHALKWFHNIPVVSYMVLKGKCAFCGNSISPMYPTVELCMAFLSLGLFLKFGFSTIFFSFFLLAAALVVVSFIDLELKIIPDIISLPGIGVGFLSSIVRPDLSVIDSLIGIVVGGGVLFLVFLGYYVLTKREGMGMGDVKLLAMIGAFLGWRPLLFIILSSSLLGAVVGLVLMIAWKKDTKLAVPFGPFLSLGTILYIFIGKELIALYMGLIG